MPDYFIETHLKKFLSIPYQSQGPVGIPPQVWAKKRGLQRKSFFKKLPNYHLDRVAVRRICQNHANSVLFAYICVMAWGGQGGGKNSRNAKTACESIQRNSGALEKLRQGLNSRSESYELFTDKNQIKGLGPAFFTKLLYFFHPSPTFYIMDQWTAKSVNLLTKKEVVKIDNESVSKKNTGKNYDNFCQRIDSLAQIAGCTGEQIEERLFSRGGTWPWPWRKYLVDKF
ncbi:hypothetical protein QQ054_24370 [Oscillatoria amoena NRMC-F 0135]|nr:hypothetical protein [Oscillatoria amoena NRMC-F 0135]